MKNEYLVNKSSSPLVYFLNTEDVQNIAKDYIGRVLTSSEIKKIIEPIAENINWVEAIEYAIEQNIKNLQTISR